MAIFLIVPTLPGDGISKALEAHKLNIPYYPLPHGEFLVSFKGTSKELSDLLGISEGKTGSAIVAAISSYFGRASTDIWEWVQVHWEG
ncbi:MAG: hypothetical protein IBX50_18520 [Marinospirillum sp.]|uniref:hypothetical protein n=1 Tax=Marinospirillum sp. TaxID=2183934 RepID=UPI0019FA4F36|nr:hypothetical protein [Marinospirillum sp.]MBE0508682.1 hypothetical protein [Marinospirillum sp.]